MFFLLSIAFCCRSSTSPSFDNIRRRKSQTTKLIAVILNPSIIHSVIVQSAKIMSKPHSGGRISMSTEFVG